MTDPAGRAAVIRVTGRARLWLATLAGLLIMIGLFCTGVGLGQVVRLPSLAWFGRGADGPALGTGQVLPRSTPTRITIPELALRARVIPVGLARDGSIAVPFDRTGQTAGWFADGPTPGEYGSAVIVGHVDTRTGPAIFHRLATLDRGDRIEITRRDRHPAVFRVDSVERFAKSAFPAHRVRGDFSRPRLVLITCGGAWLGGDIGYRDNIFVFASLLPRP